MYNQQASRSLRAVLRLITIAIALAALWTGFQILNRPAFPQWRVGGRFKVGGRMRHSGKTSTPAVLSICTVSSTICTAITLTGETYSPTTFAGYADASIRCDPATISGNTCGHLWMAYSWPNAGHGAAAIETHLSDSTDGGATWNFVKILFPSGTQTDLSTGNTVYSSNEVIDILPVGGGRWAAIRLTYWEPAGGQNLAYTSRFAYTTATGTTSEGPSNLTSATPQYIGTTANSHSDFPIDPANNFQTKSAQLSSCSSFREPALWLDANTGQLVLVLGCGNLHFSGQFVASSSTSATPTWTYQSGTNTFATQTDANSLCAYTHACSYNLFITEPEIAQNHANNKTLMCMSLVRLSNAGARISTGAVCAELDVSSIPYVFQRSGGNIVIDATVLSPDSITGGPGSSTYDAYSATGVILAHKLTNCTIPPYASPFCSTQGGFFSMFMQSLLQP